MANGTVLVASPSATASTPVAMGSSVPACPAFCASNMRRTMATAWVDVIPCGLSTTTQPCTAAPFRLRLIAFVRVFLQVTLDAGGLQQGLDLFSLGEGSVFQKAQFRRELERDGLAHQPANKSFMAIKGVDDGLGILATQRLHEHSGMPHVTRWFDLRHRNGNAFEIRIAHLAARQNFREGMPQQFSHPQLPLRWTAFLSG